jgi:hypothetical protein
MIQNYSATEILTTGINQAVMHGAPPEVVANLRGALAFVSMGSVVSDEPKEVVINALVPAGPAEGVANDE